MKVEEKILTLDGLKLQAKYFGDAKKPPLLALHGWLDNLSPSRLF